MICYMKLHKFKIDCDLIETMVINVLINDDL